MGVTEKSLVILARISMTILNVHVVESVIIPPNQMYFFILDQNWNTSNKQILACSQQSYMTSCPVVVILLQSRCSQQDTAETEAIGRLL